MRQDEARAPLSRRPGVNLALAGRVPRRRAPASIMTILHSERLKFFPETRDELSRVKTIAADYSAPSDFLPHRARSH
jgi:hypothetical protein